LELFLCWDEARERKRDGMDEREGMEERDGMEERGGMVGSKSGSLC